MKIPARDVDSGIAAMAEGDPEQIRRTRTNLAIAARTTDDPELRRQIRKVLAGRSTMRELARSAAYNKVVGRRVDNIGRGLEQLTDEQRAEIWDADRPRTSDARLAQLRGAGDVEPDQESEADEDE